MNVILERDAYEKLIRQIVCIEEDLDGIAQRAADAKLFRTQKRARWFFEEYVKEVESLFRSAEVIVKGTRCDIYVNKLPFIVLGSSFTLTDDKKGIRMCRMSYDALPESSGLIDIYFLSEAGRALLMKEEGGCVSAALGSRPREFTVSSISMV